MALSLGVRSVGRGAAKGGGGGSVSDPRMQAARAKVLAACKANHVAFLNSMSSANVVEMIKEGVMVGGIVPRALRLERLRKLPGVPAHESAPDAPKLLPAKPASELLTTILADDTVGITCSLDTLKEATGASSEALARHLFSQTALASGPISCSAAGDNYAAIYAQLVALAPQDPVEGMLAAQMVAAHNLAMAVLTKASRDVAKGPEAASRADKQLSRGLKLIAAFQRGLECLERHRGKGHQQRIIVEHIDQAAILVEGDKEKK